MALWPAAQAFPPPHAWRGSNNFIQNDNGGALIDEVKHRFLYSLALSSK
jgi:hypothetical protein